VSCKTISAQEGFIAIKKKLKTMKKLVLRLIAVLILGSALSGCSIEYREHHHHMDHGHDHDHDHNDRD
jgi:hypothetical protein